MSVARIASKDDIFANSVGSSRSSQYPMRMQIQPFLIAGVDEAGRGPLAGPVVAAAVILDPARAIDSLLDSKLLKQAQREKLDKQIRKQALAYCIAEASVEEIDDINILHASMLAMTRAVDGLSIRPSLALIDGNRCPSIDCPAAAVVKGDQYVQAISAASILAKVARDRLMVQWHATYPAYGFEKHKGYPTAQHRQAIVEFGITPLHRRSFRPVHEAVAHGESNDATMGKGPTRTRAGP